MKCPICKKTIPEDSDFCPFCGTDIQKNNTEKEPFDIDTEKRKTITNKQRYFDPDFGYSEANPLVVSSVETIWFYLSAFRTEDNLAFKWKFLSERNGVYGYSLFVDEELFGEVYFFPEGLDSTYFPKGIVFDQKAFLAAKTGKSIEEYEADLRLRQETEKQQIQEEIKARQEKNKIKKKKRKKVILLSSCVVVFAIVSVLIIIAITHKDFVNYSLANFEINTGKFDSAIERLEKLKDYRDSSSLLKNAYKLKAVEQYEKKKYEETVRFFELSDIYSDKNAESGNLEKLLDSVCNVTKTYCEQENYVKAFLFLKRYKKLKSNYSLSQSLDEKQIEKITIEYYATFLSSEYVADLYNAIENLEPYRQINERASKLIELLNERAHEVNYLEGIDAFEKGDYATAANVFYYLFDPIKGEEYKDSRQKYIESMYGYVQTKKSNVIIDDSEVYLLGDLDTSMFPYAHSLFYTYAKQLADLDYRDSKEYYEKLTKWKASVVVNNNEDDKLNNVQTLGMYDTFYFHVYISGGEIDAKVNVKYKITMPTGQVLKDSFDNLSFGSTFWASAYYEQPQFGRTGTCVFELFDESGNCLATAQVRIV